VKFSNLNIKYFLFFFKKKAKSNFLLQNFLDCSKLKENDLLNLDSKTLKELYLMDIKNGQSLLWIAQNKNDNEFDGYNYTSLMYEISENLYDLPLKNENLPTIKLLDLNKKETNKISEYPLDELFMWSILIYSGKEDDLELIKFYWSLTTKPIACALAAIIVYDRLMKKSFINREFKEQLKEVKEEFKEWSTNLLHKCSQAKLLETQDLILIQNKYFYNHTLLELGVEAKAETFIGSIPVQDLLTDIWHGKINPHVSSFRIISCVFCWPLIYFLQILRYDYELVTVVDKKKLNKVADNNDDNKIINNEHFHVTDLPFRLDGNESQYARLFYFLNAPIIKYVHHFLMHILMLMIFCYLVLFDLWPLSNTFPAGKYEQRLQFGTLKLANPLTEIFIIVYMFSNLIAELREVY
jgi:hypothetical protein